MGPVAIVFALIPFFFSLSSSSSQIVNGEVVSQSSLDYVALACGALAVGMALFEFFNKKKSLPPEMSELAGEGSPPAKSLDLVLVLAALLGFYQVVRGLGVL